jgi:hypothetical protein
MKKTKKLISIFFIIVTLSQVSAYSVVAQTVDWADIGFDIKNAVETTVDTTTNLKKYFEEGFLSRVALRLSRKVLDKMTDSVINWSAGGFKKEGPSFIPNWKEYATDIAWSTASELTEEITYAAVSDVDSKLNAADKKQIEICSALDLTYGKILNYYYSNVFLPEITTSLQSTTIGGRAISTQQQGVNADGTLPTNRVQVVTTTTQAPKILSTPLIEINKRLAEAGFGPLIKAVDPNNVSSDPNLRAFLEEEYIYGSDDYDVTITNSQNKKDVLGQAQQEKVAKEREKCALNQMIRVKGFTYASGLTQYLSAQTRNTVNGKLAKGTFGTPNLGSVPKAVQQKWGNWKTDASQGGWALWQAAAELGNSPIGSKLVAQAELNEQVNAKLREAESQRDRSGGFLDRGVCLIEKVSPKTGEKFCQRYDATTPGGVIGQAVTEKITGKFEELRSVNSWTDMLIVTGVKLATGVLQKGVIPLAENAIRNGLTCGSTDCTKKSFALDATDIASSTEQAYNSGGSFDEVVDIPAVLYGDPVVERNAAGEIVYEDSGILDVDGKPIPDYQNPKLVYEREVVSPAVYEYPETGNYDDNGNPILDYSNPKLVKAEVLGGPLYETIGGVPVIGSDGNKIRKPKRENGAIVVTREVISALDIQNSLIRGIGVRKLAELDGALPGPDVGWEQRLNTKVSEYGGDGQVADGQKAMIREIKEFVKGVFDAGVNGSVDNDPTDVALISSDGIPYTQPAVSFIDFDTEKLQKVPQPTQLTLTKIGANRPDVYNVISMNTFAGTWKNPDTGKYEAVGNIPTATEMRDMAGYVAEMYKTTIDEYKRAIVGYRPLLSRLQTLEKDYQKLPRITRNADGKENLESRAARIAAEKKIAYALSQLREKIPNQDILKAAKTTVEVIQEDIKKVEALIVDSKKYRNEPKYTERYINLFLKDEMGVLYCAFQDHSNINRADAETRRKMFELAGKKAPSRTTGGEIRLHFATLGVSSLVDLFKKDTNIIPTFGGGAAQAKEWEKVYIQRYNETYGQTVPYRCFETSQICSKEFPCKKTDELLSCPIYGHSIQDQEYHMDNIAIPCKSIYKASLSDYLEYIDPADGI